MDNTKAILTSELKTVLKEAEKVFLDMTFSIDAMTESLQSLKNAIEKFDNNLPRSLTILANSGWYISWDTLPGSIFYYSREIENGNQFLVDNEIMSLLDEDVDGIEYRLISNFPHRRNAISAAIKAHKEGMYYLSIPVFFAQIEGICNEITGIRFFAIKNGSPKISSWVSNFKPNSFIGELLEPLNNISDVRQTQVKGLPNGLNRHDVLHGDSLDYGENKVNSYKTLSLLLYVGEIVFDSKSRI